VSQRDQSRGYPRDPPRRTVAAEALTSHLLSMRVDAADRDLRSNGKRWQPAATLRKTLADALDRGFAT
jgi:hypothetical protein